MPLNVGLQQEAYLFQQIKKRRARKKDGTFVKDDKSTPDVNEAWEEVEDNG